MMNIKNLLEVLRKLKSTYGVITSLERELLTAEQDQFYLYKAKVNSITRFGPSTPPLIGFGFSSDEDLAELKSLCEALERFCGANYSSRSQVRGAMGSLASKAIDPLTCLGYSDEQYSATRFAFRKPIPEDQHTWAPCVNLHNQTHLYVHSDLVAMSPRAVYARASSIGMAIHYQESMAVEAALLELLERDHLAIAFWHGEPVPQIEIGNEPPEVQRQLTSMSEAGYEVHCLHLNLGLGVHVILWLAFRQAEAPYFLKGAAAHFRFDVAKAKAFDELLRSFLYYKSRPFTLLSNAQGAMKNLMHYQKPNVKERLGFLLGPYHSEPSGNAIQQSFGLLLDHLEKHGFQVLAVDMTHELVEKTGLRCVRVIVPGLVKTPLGSEPWQLGLPRLRRQGEARDTALATNHEPHFFS